MKLIFSRFTWFLIFFLILTAFFGQQAYGFVSKHMGAPQAGNLFWILFAAAGIFILYLLIKSVTFLIVGLIAAAGGYILFNYVDIPQMYLVIGCVILGVVALYTIFKSAKFLVVGALLGVGLWFLYTNQYPDYTRYGFIAAGVIVIIILISRQGILRVALQAVILGGLIYFATTLKVPAERFHLISYATLGYLMLFDTYPRMKIVGVVISVAALAATAMAEELIQYVLPNRVGEFRDVFLNLIGGAAGMLIYLIGHAGRAVKKREDALVET